MNERRTAGTGGETLAEALARIGEPASAVAEGRVFVDGRRAHGVAAPVQENCEIVVREARRATPRARTLSEWQNLYACEKPAGLPTEPDRRGNSSLVFDVARELRVSPSALHAVTRLDLPVSGIVVVARGPAAKQLAAALKREGRLRRRYLALVTGGEKLEAGVWDAPIGARGRKSRGATTHYRAVATAGGPDLQTTLLVLEPATGRMHQLRIHAANAGAPMLGDGVYGGVRRVVAASGRVTGLSRVALHAARLEARENETGAWSVVSPAPPEFVGWWSELGGDPGAFDRAITLPWLYSADRSCK